MSAKVSGASTSIDAPLDDDYAESVAESDVTDIMMDQTTPRSSVSLSSKTSGRGRNVRQETAERMAYARERTIRVQEQMLNMMKPVSEPTERQAFGEWITTLIKDIDPSLWRQFRMRLICVVDEFLTASENM